MDLTLKPNTLLSQKRIEDTVNTFRKIATCVIVVILAIIMFGQGFTQAEAKIKKEGRFSKSKYTVTTTNDTYEVKDLKSPLLGPVVLDMALDVYGGASTFESSLLVINTDSDTWSAVQAAYEALSAFGAGLALLWCLLELVEKASAGHITGEFILQLSIKLTIAVIVIGEGGEVAKGVINLANGVTKTLVTSFTGESGDALDAYFVEVWNEIKDEHLFGMIGTMLSLLVPAIISKLCMIIIYALLAGRVLEVAIRYVFFPIGASDVFTHGMGSPGFRYIKKLFGASLQGIAMYIVMRIGMLMMTDAESYVGASAVAETLWPVIVFISMIGGMLKVSSIVNDIAG